MLKSHKTPYKTPPYDPYMKESYILVVVFNLLNCCFCWGLGCGFRVGNLFIIICKWRF